MELDLGCREDVEVRQCFSSPEILELKAQCELAPVLTKCRVAKLEMKNCVLWQNNL